MEGIALCPRCGKKTRVPLTEHSFSECPYPIHKVRVIPGENKGAQMKDKEFLKWIHDRLVNVHGENIDTDYMYKLRAIIYNTDERDFSINSLSFEEDEEVRDMEVGDA
jgi:hypothetical protein